MDVVPLASGTRADRSVEFQPKGQSAAPVASAASSDSGWDECRRGLMPATLMRRGESQKAKPHHEAPKARPSRLFAMKDRPQRQPATRRAARRAFGPQRPRRQPYRAHRSRAAELDGADDRAVAVDAPGAARAVETIEGEKLAGHEAPRRVRAEGFRTRQARCEQGRNHNREPRNHPDPLPRYRRCGNRNRPLTIRIRRDFAGCWSTNPQRGYRMLTTMRPRTRPSTMSRAASITSARPIFLVMAASFPRSRSLANRCHAIRRSAIGRLTESMPRSEAARRINGATEVGKSMPPASPQSRRTASSKAHWRAWSSWPRRAARPALFSQRFCGLFAFDDVGRRQGLSNDWPGLAGRSRP